MATIDPGEVTVKAVAGLAPKRTEVAPPKSEPAMVTRPPPVVGPLIGITEVTRGEMKVNVDEGTAALVPAAGPVVVVTVTADC